MGIRALAQLLWKQRYQISWLLRIYLLNLMCIYLEYITSELFSPETSLSRVRLGSSLGGSM